jgi:hypothetical protein
MKATQLYLIVGMTMVMPSIASSRPNSQDQIEQQSSPKTTKETLSQAYLDLKNSWADGAQRCDLTPATSNYPPCLSVFRCSPRPAFSTKDALDAADRSSVGECSTTAWANATATCGADEPQPKCLQPGFECVLGPYDNFSVKVGRCLPKGTNVLGTLPQRCGGGYPDWNTPGYGSCPVGQSCYPLPNARCARPPPSCVGRCGPNHG